MNGAPPLYVAGTAVIEPSRAEEFSLEELVFRAASGSLADAGLGRGDIDGLCIAASDQLDGRLISSMHLSGPAGGYLRDEIKVTDDGAGALAAAVLRLEAGVSERVLVVSWTKPSETDAEGSVAVNPDPVLRRPVGLHPVTAEALLVGRFLHDHALGPDVLDRLAEQVGGASDPGPLVAWPLRRGHLPPPTDAAVALVLTTEAGPTRLRGLAWASDHPDPTARTSSPSERLRQLYGRALGDPEAPVETDVVETTDRNVGRLVMAALGLELVRPGDVAAQVASGPFDRLNPSGGLWRRNPPVAAGLERVVTAVAAVGDGARRAVAHSSYGRAGQGQLVAIVEAAT